MTLRELKAWVYLFVKNRMDNNKKIFCKLYYERNELIYVPGRVLKRGAFVRRENVLEGGQMCGGQYIVPTADVRGATVIPVCVGNRHYLIVSFKIYAHMQSRLCANVCWSVTREWRNNRRSNVIVHPTDGAVSSAVGYRGQAAVSAGLIVHSQLIIWRWRQDSQTCRSLFALWQLLL